jgi:hypothetical protein
MRVKCKRCGKGTGPAFGLCAECIQKEDGTRNHYIEFRVYLKDDANIVIVHLVAEQLRDILTDETDPDVGPPDTFTQEVTYEVVRTNNTSHYSSLTNEVK